MRDPIAKFEIEMEEIGWWTGGGNLNWNASAEAEAVTGECVRESWLHLTRDLQLLQPTYLQRMSWTPHERE